MRLVLLCAIMHIISAFELSSRDKAALAALLQPLSESANKSSDCHSQSKSAELVSCSDKPLSKFTALRVLDLLTEGKHTPQAELISFLESSTAVGSTVKSKKWWFLGPFPIGKHELDGDPVVDVGGSEHVLPSQTLFSELTSSGTVKWTKVPVQQDRVQLQPAGVDWNGLVSSMNTMTVLEWQGWMHAPIGVVHAGVYLLQCLGVAHVQLAGRSYTGDLYHRPMFHHPVSLQQGVHTLKMHVRAKVQATVGCTLTFQRVNKVMGLQIRKGGVVPNRASWTARVEEDLLPNILDNSFLNGYIAVHVSNYAQDTLRVTSCTSDTSMWSCHVDNELKLSFGDHVLLPVSLHLVKKQSKCRNTVSLTLHGMLAAQETDIKLSLKLECRTSMTQSFDFTFLDMDGSVQKASAIAPRLPCQTLSQTSQDADKVDTQASASAWVSAHACPVVISFHGTGASSRSQADSYKVGVSALKRERDADRKSGKTTLAWDKWLPEGLQSKDDDYLFGFPSAWVVAPTRHGAHNWEGPGYRTALSALNHLAHLSVQEPFSLSQDDRITCTESCDGESACSASACSLLKITLGIKDRTDSLYLSRVADTRQLIVAGHSMGGHGAWHFAVHNADRTLGLLPAAGWLSKQTYGDSNQWNMFDVQRSFGSADAAAAMEAAFVQYDADKHASNLRHIPIQMHVGTNDRTVNPFFHRRMRRVLSQHGVDAQVVELRGKEHWWWDSVQPNDGGAVFDLKCRTFFERVLNQRAAVSEHCFLNQEGATALLTVYDPYLTQSKWGVTVVQQIVARQRSTISVSLISTSSVRIETENVKMMTFADDAVRGCPIAWKSLDLSIDGQHVDLSNGPSACLSSGVWLPCPSSPVQPSAADAFSLNPFVIVALSRDEDESMMSLAQYLSHQFLQTSNAYVPISSTLPAPEQQANAVILAAGGSSTELHARVERFLSSRVAHGQMSESACCVQHVLLSIAHTNTSLHCTCTSPLASFWKQGAALIVRMQRDTAVIGYDIHGLQTAIVSWATPTIPPMARSPLSNGVPDFVLFSSSIQARGIGAIRFAGFWNN